jgi:hypothetical protein
MEADEVDKKSIALLGIKSEEAIASTGSPNRYGGPPND